MTAVAPPLTLQPNSRLGWTSNGNNGFAAMSSEDSGRMFPPGPRKAIQRQNSASSIASSTSTSSTSSTSTTVAAPSTQTNGGVPSSTEGGSWAVRKKPSRGLWPPGKAEPATGITTARPQPVNSSTSGPSASSAISALHAPVQAQPQMANGPLPANGLRAPAQNEPPAILHLLPMNGTFERKTITVPYYPEVLRVGRQTNQKTVPTPLNGYFDSKVLSRQHAEVWADRNGRIFIRDVKSSNGTFVNGMRLSQENKESEPRELREQDVLELGIDIVSEDQKTVVHHKVAAKVEHAGVYGQAPDVLSFGDLDPSGGGGGLVNGAHQLKRNGSQGSFNGRGVMNTVVGPNGAAMGMANQPQHLRNWMNPITTEQIVKRLHAEMRMARQQSDDLLRARQTIAIMLSGKFDSPPKDEKSGSDRVKVSPSKSKTDLKAHFTEPPLPPPSAPLPEKPDVARALNDPVIQPILRRNDTVLPTSSTNSPTRVDHSSDILRLCEELKLAKGEISHQSERMKSLESELAQERTARESAEERAQKLEQGERRDSPRDSFGRSSESEHKDLSLELSKDLQAQLDRLHATMDEMKQQMEIFRGRAETAEAERDEVRKSLAEMIEEKRKDLAEKTRERSHSPQSRPQTKRILPSDVKEVAGPNGHVISPPPSSPTSDILLERAGVEEGQPITLEQAKILTEFLTQEVLAPETVMERDGSRAYYGIPITSAAAVILLGVVLMNWGNGWPKIDR